MRTINVKKIRDAVETLCIKANIMLPADISAAMASALKKEKSVQGRQAIEILIANARISKKEKFPICQDTGFVVLFIEAGQEVVFTGGDLKKAVTAGVKAGYKKAYLRKSIVADPIKRKNTKDNTPAVIHFDVVKGDKVKITILPKGGGGENVSALKMLKPSDGIEGIKEFIVDTVKNAGAGACPPVIVGVGIGGTFDKAPYLAKKALLRPVGKPNKDPFYAKLEKQVLNDINKTGIGPSGFGGIVTALAVHIDTHPCHIASLPCAVNIQCNAHRYKKIIL